MWNFSKSLFKKSGTSKKIKKMEVNEQSMQDSFNRYSVLDFQWIKGDDISNVEKFKSVTTNGENVFIEFQSGKKINADLVAEYFVTFPASDVDFVKNPTPAQPKLLPSLTKNSSVTSIVYESEQDKKDSPIYNLLKKQKNNSVEVSIKIKLNLPPKELYSVLLGSFDDAESEIIQFVLDGIDIEDIKISLAESIKRSYYSDSQKSDSDQEDPIRIKRKSQTKETQEELK